jgi:hypothetical protein
MQLVLITIENIQKPNRWEVKDTSKNPMGRRSGGRGCEK